MAIKKYYDSDCNLGVLDGMPRHSIISDLAYRAMVAMIYAAKDKVGRMLENTGWSMANRMGNHPILNAAKNTKKSANT